MEVLLRTWLQRRELSMGSSKPCLISWDTMGTIILELSHGKVIWKYLEVWDVPHQFDTISGCVWRWCIYLDSWTFGWRNQAPTGTPIFKDNYLIIWRINKSIRKRRPMGIMCLEGDSSLQWKIRNLQLNRPEAPNMLLGTGPCKTHQIANIAFTSRTSNFCKYQVQLRR